MTQIQHLTNPERRTDPAAVWARDLTRTFGDFTAVDAISFEVARGEVFGFLGANGAGKTTAIKMLTGLLAPSCGRGAHAPGSTWRRSPSRSSAASAT